MYSSGLEEYTGEHAEFLAWLEVTEDKVKAMSQKFDLEGSDQLSSELQVRVCNSGTCEFAVKVQSTYILHFLQYYFAISGVAPFLLSAKWRF